MFSTFLLPCKPQIRVFRLSITVPEAAGIDEQRLLSVRRGGAGGWLGIDRVLHQFPQASTIEGTRFVEFTVLASLYVGQAPWLNLRRMLRDAGIDCIVGRTKGADPDDDGDDDNNDGGGDNNDGGGDGGGDGSDDDSDDDDDETGGGCGGGKKRASEAAGGGESAKRIAA